MVKEAKDKETPTPYEMTHLVIQAFDELSEVKILTQSPIIQRTSQRLNV